MTLFKIIPRGRVYHSLSKDILDMFRALFSKRDLQKVSHFEKTIAEYMKSNHCIAFSFARTAFYFSLKAVNIPENSEIIMPPITIKPFLDVVLCLKLKPVFVDLDPDTLCYDCNQLEKAITKNTKAINITYLYGITPDMDPIINIAKKYNLFIVEDFSHNINAEYKGKKLGTFGDVGIYSASSTKTFDIHGAGLLITENNDIANSLRKYQNELEFPPRIILLQKIITNFIRNIATKRSVFSLLTFPFIKLLKMISSEEVIKFTGTRPTEPIEEIPKSWLYTFDPLQAEFGFRELSTLEKNDAHRINNVHKIKKILKDAGKEMVYPMERKDSKCVFWQFSIYFNNALKTQDKLHKNNVDSATTSLMLISTLPYLQHQYKMPVAENIHNNLLIVPAFPGLTKNDINLIGKALQVE